jgi:MSHA biogenesis protein MshE
MSRPQKFRLGDLLVQEGLISAIQLDEALQEQRSSGSKLGQVLIDKQWLT